MLISEDLHVLYLGKWNKSVPVRIQSFSIDDSSRYYRAEEMVLTQCHHTNIVKLYGVCSDSAKLYIVTEMAPHGSLNELIKQQDRTFPQLLNFAVQVNIIIKNIVVFLLIAVFICAFTKCDLDCLTSIVYKYVHSGSVIFQ